MKYNFLFSFEAASSTVLKGVMWCTANLETDNWDFKVINEGMQFTFKNEKDAALFALVHV